MRRFHLGLAAFALPVVALTLFIAGCGKDEKKDTSSTGGGDTNETPKDLKVLVSKGGVLKGTIKLTGAPPDLSALTEELHEKMKKQDREYCMMGKETETTEQAYRIGKNGNLGNVFVWVKPDTDSFFQVDKKQLKDLDKEVVIDQPHCAFIPHCLFLFSQYHADAKNPRALTPTGQIWKVKNDATISHNTNYKGGQKNKGDNVILAKNTARPIDNLVPDSKEIDISCNIHPWMNAFMWVVDTPYYGLSRSDTLTGANKAEKNDAEFGSYEITNLPVGQVRVVAWHEKCEFLNKNGAQGEVIQILPEGKKTEKNFEATPK